MRFGTGTTQTTLAVAMLLLAALMSGCTRSLSALRAEDFPRTTVRSAWASAGIQDARPSFQPYFCRRYRKTVSSPDWPECEHWLWQPAAAEPAEAGANPEEIPPRVRRTVIIVPGILGECVQPWVTPFSADHEYLKTLGYIVKVVPVEGRASAERNARIIHDYLTERAERLDERNDGQMLMDDAVMPGSQVLGIFRADHWSIALPFAESPSLRMKPLAINNTFPRRALIAALLDYIASAE